MHKRNQSNAYLLSDLSRNLRILCERHGSVSGVCRALSINRTQFAKYLAGSMQPSARNLRRICQFFDISEKDLSLQVNEFRERYGSIETVTDHRSDVSVSLLKELAGITPLNDVQANRFTGYYHAYTYSRSYLGKIERALVRICRSGEMLLTRTCHRLPDPLKPEKSTRTLRMDGILLGGGERVVHVQNDAMDPNYLETAFLTPAPGKPVLMGGIVVCPTADSRRQAAASRTVWVKLDGGYTLRTAIRETGYFCVKSPQVPDAIRMELSRVVDKGIPVLDAAIF